ncbi:hypothetical protein J4H92_06740 [Leucobacter weissii]|uniref:Uncharacterized protein n=1 Tax=Leucobacter weissii TaxID=1983706 RepID=A0A939SBS3_9MICO|nr:hypothetical protein [Leucobacter weissii]MBO1901648.1 hypothetical protein [Leucobacter weissii]
MAVVAAAALALGGLVFTDGATPAAAASPPVGIVSIASSVDPVGRLGVKLNCSSKKTCSGTATVRVSGVNSSKARFSVGGRKAKIVRIALSAKQLQSIHDATGGRRSVEVRVQTKKPVKKTVRKSRSVRMIAPLRVTSLDTRVSSAGRVGFTVACVEVRACKGSASLTLGGTAGGRVAVSVPAKKSRSYTAVLNAKQRATLSAAAGGALGARVSVALSAPIKLTVVGSGSVRSAPTPPDPVDPPDPIDPTDPGGGHEHGEDPVYSHAYQNSWRPSEYDTCTQEEHDGYAVTGPDGKLYPGWHPSVHERADGTTCTFGHEHGDDPRRSSIYTWVLQKLREENPEVDGIPFGYTSERLMEYAEANGGGVHRHEDDPGHKVVISNNQAMLRGPYPADQTSFVDEFGQSKNLRCDFLIKIHQGSHSPDATRNNTHELFYAMKCNDGSELVTNKLTNFGDPNELATSCSREFSNSLAAFSGAPLHLETSGSDLPQGEGGERHLPTTGCLAQHMFNGSVGVDSRYPDGPLFNDRNDFMASPDSVDPGWWWAGYEQWQSFNTIRAVDGTLLAQYEPWFGIQNPSRYWDETTGQIAYLNDLAWADGNHQLIPSSIWKEQRSLSPAAPIDRKDPRAYFNGAQRDAWLAKALVKNESGHSTLYIDPWGRNAQATPFTGAIRIHISERDNSALVPTTRPVTANRGGLAGYTREGAERSGPTAPRKIRHLDGSLTNNRFFFNYGIDAQGDDLGIHAPN